MARDRTTSWYDLERVDVEPNPMRITTAALRNCLLCNSTIDTMGGPGRSLCVPCGDDILAGRFRGAIKRDKDGNLLS